MGLGGEDATGVLAGGPWIPEGLAGGDALATPPAGGSPVAWVSSPPAGGIHTCSQHEGLDPYRHTTPSQHATLPNSLDEPLGAGPFKQR